MPSAEALAHANGCLTCGPARAAWDAMKGAPASSAGLATMHEFARAELRSKPKPRMWWVDAGVLLGINLAVAAIAASVFGIAPVGTHPPVSAWGIAAALVGLMGFGSWAAVRPGARSLRTVTLGIAGLAAAWIFVGGSGIGDGRLFSAGIGCALISLGVCLVPLLVGLWVTSRFAFDVTRAISAGASVGATGMFVLHLHCANGTASHLLTFHVLSWVAVTLTALVIRRALPSRSYAA